jgi:hypothetical protein
MKTQDNLNINKPKRIATRVSGEHKALFERAARLRGLSLTDFMTSSAYNESIRIIQDHQLLIELNPEASALFVERLMQPRDVSELPNLQQAVNFYQQQMDR